MSDNFSLYRLLAWLDSDSVKGDERYVQFHEELVAYLEPRGAHTVAQELADEALNRVDKRLATSLLNEHFNSTEIRDVLNLCRIFGDEGARNSPSPSRRIWSFLSPTDQSLVRTIAETGTFDSNQRSRLSQALNDILRRRDFYHAEDFNPSVFRRNIEIDSLIGKLDAEIARGLSELSQSEIEKFNRQVLEAAYPQIIKTNLADTPDAEKLARCKRYARNVLLEYLKEPLIFSPPTEVTDEPVTEDTNEDKDEVQLRLVCLEECKRLKLSPRDSVVFDLYFTGIIIRSPEDEPLSDHEIRDVRKPLPEKIGVSPETIRTIARRCKEVLFQCIKRCMKRQEKN